jgi:hypothetical protein
VETLVVGSRVTLHDLPAILMNEDLLPNLSAITLVTPSSTISRHLCPPSLFVTNTRREEDRVFGDIVFTVRRGSPRGSSENDRWKDAWVW